MKDYFKLLRPRHWIKNIFVFAPAFFAQKIELIFQEPSTCLTFLAFCLSASMVYVFNDWIDFEEDRAHPVKKERPFAAGKISINGMIFLLFLLGAILAVCLWFSKVWIPLVTYIVLNIAYTFVLKHFAIIDITVISIGFVLRIIAGGYATDVDLSHWLIMLTFLLAMCLALGKRRAELLLFTQNQKNIRKSLSAYNPEFVDMALAFLASTTAVSYLMYCMSEEVMARFQTSYIFYTSFFVILGLLRFLQIAIVHQDAGSPTEILLKDRFIQINLILWILTFYFLIY